MNKAIEITHRLLEQLGATPTVLGPLSAIILVFVSCLALWVAYQLMSRLLEPTLNRITRRTSFTWDDIVFRPKAVRWVWALFVCLLAGAMLPASLAAYPAWESAARVAVRIGLILTLMMLTIEGMKSIFLLIADHENVDKIAEQMHHAADNGEEFVYMPSHSLKGLQQMLTIVIVGVSSILVVSLLLGKDPLIIFSGLGAAAAVLMLIFQDSILGVVAGVQLTANDMLQPGDWIIVPKYEANGIVREVTLATVKIQNWDKTIITIPPYKLISEGFQNWRGMQDSHGRRITRSLLIDISTVRMGTPEENAAWRAQPWGAMIRQEGDIPNITAFRAYLEHYITKVPTFVPSMLYMVRELPATPQGLPVEMYFFTSRTDWKGYELVLADTQDQILSQLSQFGLRVYQAPSTADFGR